MGLLDKIRQSASSLGARIRGAGAAVGRVARTRLGRVGIIAASFTPVGRIARFAGLAGRAALRLGGAVAGSRAIVAIGGGALGGGLATVVAGRGVRTPEIVAEREGRRRTPTRRLAPTGLTGGLFRRRTAGPLTQRPGESAAAFNARIEKRFKAERPVRRARRKRIVRRVVRGVRRVGRFVRAHKATIRGALDIAHKVGKKGISLKTIRASIASPRTPEQLKRGLRKLLRKKSAHIRSRGHGRR